MTGKTVEYVVWRRTDRRGKWVTVGTAATHEGAVALVQGKGDWLIREGGSDPNQDRKHR